MRIFGLVLLLIGILLCLTIIGAHVGIIFMLCGALLIAFGARKTIIIRDRWR